MGREWRRRLSMLGWAFERIGLGLAAAVMFALALVGAGLITIWIGFPIVLIAVGGAGGLAKHRRRRVGALLGRPVDDPYLRAPTGSPFTRVGALAADPAVRRDMLWVFVDMTLGLILAGLSLVEAILDLLLWWLPPAVFTMIHARLDYALLAESEKSRLALRVQQLTESRAQTVHAQAAELRRIERDLHDGAQARLVALGMSLAMAEERLASDPAAARTMLADARTASSTALGELRDLVRGIHPPVLADRGLVGAIQALALAAPIPIEVRADLSERLPAPVESAAYFALAEALTNVVKHSNAQHAEVVIRRLPDVVQLGIQDDGRGGADPGAGTGLRGIERRLAAFDGSLQISSPPGGPTQLAMVLPCASSSPKILPSSETD